ncbi:hypothetical protein M011DRAFT_404971 [Sporormia fimetaria CBS 119925]|uniref:DUF7719 domain-containing protein n=1 Tax=Sporormia fimetaria CBS 119925 TaxID=1340428 RepID=A0A6A6V7J4_9PLEO|nr:hypothetical protein M011DRAFT_404971 [Sporormia fimetaria CBS 119925]
MAAGNRKERRAAAKNSATTSNGASTSFQSTDELDEDAVNILLKHPDRAGPKGKTLFELAEERRRELNKGKETENNDAEDLIGPAGNAILYSISMAMLHLTLDVIVYNQYREEIIWPEIFKRAGTALPIFFVLVYLLHVDTAKRIPVLRNLFFFVVSIAAGCYMIYSGNVHGYFYVMKAAPPIGAFWVWSVIEMDLVYATGSCLVIIGYLWWNGFSAF